MPEDKEQSKVTICPKCGQEMDDRGDGVLTCGECGWEIPKGTTKATE